MSDQPHLSVVATARNDNHGGRFLYRMQHFVDGFIDQCKRHQLNAELIIVEWNPPEDTELLSQVLKFPADKGPCKVRFIRVPKEVHMKLSHSDKLPLFQMIGKNVGIRRARGKFVLATNIDILFSDKLMRFIRDNLKPSILFRVDRLDVPCELPAAHSLQEILNFCDQNYFRINGKYGTKVKIDGKWRSSLFIKSRLKKLMKIAFKKRSLKLMSVLAFEIIKKIFQKIINTTIADLAKSINITIANLAKSIFKISKKITIRLFFKAHTNACGDFTLMSNEDWSKLRGYPEWEIHSWHLDSVLLYQAQRMAIKEVDLPRSMSIFHIEHGPGSGYTPEAYQILFNRLKDSGIPYLSNSDLDKMILKKNTREPLDIYNNPESWGMSDLSLQETCV